MAERPAWGVLALVCLFLAPPAAAEPDRLYLSPIANLSYEVDCETRVVRLDAGASVDPDGRIVAWRWDFGDQSFGEGMVVEHDYARTGTFMVRLTLVDDTGHSVTQTHPILVMPCATGAFACAGGEWDAAMPPMKPPPDFFPQPRADLAWHGPHSDVFVVKGLEGKPLPPYPMPPDGIMLDMWMEVMVFEVGPQAGLHMPYLPEPVCMDQVLEPCKPGVFLPHCPYQAAPPKEPMRTPVLPRPTKPAAPEASIAGLDPPDIQDEIPVLGGTPSRSPLVPAAPQATPSPQEWTTGTTAASDAVWAWVASLATAALALAAGLALLARQRRARQHADGPQEALAE